MGYAPFFLKLNEHDRVAIVGGGALALGKAETLAATGARLFVVAPEILPELQELVQKNGGTFALEEYRATHLENTHIVIAATDDRELNRCIHEDAHQVGAFVNVVDTPELCDFIFPAIIRRGPVQITVSTEGVSPSLARLLKRLIEQALSWNIGVLAAWIKEKREVVKGQIKGFQARRLFWDKLLEGAIAQEVVEGNAAKADALFAQALAETPEAAHAALYLIGAGPGHPDYITVRGTQLLGQADVVLYDRLIAPELLNRYARKEAVKIPVGKASGDHSKTQDDITLLIEEHLRAKRIVVRLKGGDPGIYAHGAEEILVARKLGVPYQIVPGITAAIGCAAASGFPLTEREGANGVRFLTYYDEKLPNDGFWKSLALSANETLVFYMTTRLRAELFRNLITHGFSPDTPIVLIEQGTTPAHAEFEATLGTFEEKYKGQNFIMPTLLVIGDVVRWRAKLGWKEPPALRRKWFGREKIHAGN